MKDMYDDNHDGGGFSSLALLAGACLGGGLALLIAPQQGLKLRGQIKDYADKAGDGMANTWDHAIERGLDYAERGQEALKEAEKLMESAIGRGNEYIEGGKKMAKGMMYKKSSYQSDGLISAGALLAGALVGGGLALLFTPKSGVKFRKQLKSFAEKAMDDMPLVGR